MSKLNIKFNNTDYTIDESTLSEAKSSLQTHLSSVMNGSGSVIKLGDLSYNIDSTKLTTATNDFVSYLGTISGSGEKVVVNNVEYSIDSAKLSNAVADITAALDALNSGSDEGDECTITYSLSPYTYMVVDSITYNNESGTLTVPAGTVVKLAAETSAASPEGYTYIRVDGTTVASNPAASWGCEYNYTVNGDITVTGIDAGSNIISGEIDVTTQPSSSGGYTVKVQFSGVMYGEYGYYSLDNGTTWENFNELSYDEDVNGYLITNVTQIKFKIDDYAYNNGISTGIWCEEIGLNITQAGPRESENYILTSDIVVEYTDYD